MNKTIQICNFCVLDNQASEIQFDSDGVCAHCKSASILLKKNWKPDSKGEERLKEIAAEIKAKGKNKKYDAIIGLSGGVDSSYLAHYVVKVLKLKVLAVHVDSGWNTEKACRNIENLVKKLDLDLYTKVIDWAEMRSLHVAFLRSGVVNQDLPQDHSFFSTLYSLASSQKVNYFLSGVNLSSEAVTIPHFGYPAIDGFHLKSIMRLFSNKRLKNYPLMSVGKYLWLSVIRKSLTVICPLSYMNYNKDEAKRFLIKHYDFADYGDKHSESRFTRFYQNYFLPKRFGFDKRKLHLSSLIVSGQITRENALKQLRNQICTAHQNELDLKFVAKKLRIPIHELENYVNQPIKNHTDYPNSLWFLNLLLVIKGIAKRFLD